MSAREWMPTALLPYIFAIGGIWIVVGVCVQIWMAFGRKPRD